MLGGKGSWEGLRPGPPGYCGDPQGHTLSVWGVKDVLKEHQGITEKCMWLSMATRSVSVGFGSLVWV